MHALDLYEIHVCRTPGNASGVLPGMSNREVAVTAGMPVPWMSDTHSWNYRLPGDGERVFFTSSGYVSRVGHSVSSGTPPQPS